MTVKDNRVLAVGVFLSDQPNNALEITLQLSETKNWQLDLRWVAVGSGDVPPKLLPFTTISRVRKTKFEFINSLLDGVQVEDYRYLLITDDDISLPAGFLDNYLYLQNKYSFALAQPARTHLSFIDHKFVAQLLGVEARQTRFVEIGPLFSLERQAFQLLLPFDKDAPMGWGLDFVWPVVIEESGAKMGIIDGTPVTHALRKPVAFYDYTSTANAMADYLRSTNHLTKEELFIAIETYPEGGQTLPLYSPPNPCD